MRTHLLGIVCTVVASAACGRTVTLADEVDLTWDFQVTPFDRYVDDLHSPYVLGMSVNMWATSSDDGEDVSHWQIVSSDPSVLEIGNPRSIKGSFGATATARGVGSVDISVRDGSGHVLGHGKAEVALPDRVELDAHGYLILGLDARAPVSEARIAENDAATYLVRYFNQGRELYGNGTLLAPSTAGITAQTRQSYLFEQREWLTLTAAAAGASTLPLSVGGQHVADLPVVAVPASDIADVALIAQSEKGAKNGDWLTVLAQATDGAGRNVFGVDYQWNVGGVEQTADGDLYRYEYKKGDVNALTVTRAGHTDTVDIQSDRGYVDNSNRVGCSAAGGTGAVPAAAVLALALGARRRRTTEGAAHG
jgi:uncharacterized protein (TIGR03382 family)